MFGFPGTGKTNAVNNLLQQLLARGDNVLYINGVKDEGHLAALAPGRARIWRPPALGIDPFEYVPGVPAMRMIADFVEGFTYTKNLYTALESLMHDTLVAYAIYLGWGQVDDDLNDDNGPGRPFDLTAFPRLVERNIAQTAYAGEVRANLQGAADTRVNTFLASPLGRAFATNVHVPVAEFATGFNLLLLNKLQVDDQCFIAWVLLKKLYAYLASCKERGQPGALTIVLEEAHVFLTQAAPREESEYGKARAMLAEFLATLIKEGREYGARLVIVDQEPADLIRGAIQPLAETLLFRVGVRDAEIFHPDPVVAANIGTLPQFFAIYKGKDTSHEVLLRPPKFPDVSAEVRDDAVAQATQNTRNLIAELKALRATQGASNVPESEHNAGEVPLDESIVVELRVPIPLAPVGSISLPESINSDCSGEIGKKDVIPGKEPISNSPIADLLSTDFFDEVYAVIWEQAGDSGVPLDHFQDFLRADPADIEHALEGLVREGAIRELPSGAYQLV